MTVGKVAAPASASFSCPIDTSSLGILAAGTAARPSAGSSPSKQEAEISPAYPLMMFPDIRRGWYSSALNAHYLPLRRCRQYGRYMVAEVPLEHALTYTAIAGHENFGHLPRRHLLANLLTQYLCVRSYELLARAMSNGTAEPWDLLRQFNSAIADLDVRTALVEETYATIAQFSYLRSSHPEQLFRFAARDVDALEEECLFDLCTNYGSSIREFYRRLQALDERMPTELLLFPGLYAQDSVRLSRHYSLPFVSGKRVLQQFEDVVDLRSVGSPDTEQRFDAALRICEGLVSAHADPYSLTQRDLFGAFDRYLPDFSDWYTSYPSADRALHENIQRSIAFWNEAGMSNANPAVGSIIAYRCQAAVNLEPPDIDPSTWPIEDAELRSTLVEKFLHARGEGRTLLTIKSLRSERMPMPAFGFARLASDSGTDRMAPYITDIGDEVFTPSGDQSAIDMIRNHLAALTVFESLRVMAHRQIGLSCAMRVVPWAVRDGDRRYRRLQEGECCGLVKGIQRLWELGKAEATTGDDSHTWLPPSECFTAQLRDQMAGHV